MLTFEGRSPSKVCTFNLYNFEVSQYINSFRYFVKESEFDANYVFLQRILIKFIQQKFHTNLHPKLEKDDMQSMNFRELKLLKKVDGSKLAGLLDSLGLFELCCILDFSHSARNARFAICDLTLMTFSRTKLRYFYTNEALADN